MHIVTHICIRADDGMIWWLQRQSMGCYGKHMGQSASQHHFKIRRMGIYVMHAKAQTFYTSIRSVMHHPLSILPTHRRKCVHKIDT